MGRDVFNEKPSTDELLAADAAGVGTSSLPRGVVMHTTKVRTGHTDSVHIKQCNAVQYSTVDFSLESGEHLCCHAGRCRTQQRCVCFSWGDACHRYVLIPDFAQNPALHKTHNPNPSH